MAKRQALSKRLRFEIFKRDGFTCHYCGRKPPEVVLVVDHIKPVAEGGDNDDTNLITSCVECNQGKADKGMGQLSVKPDVNAEWLALQQETAELRLYQEAKAQRDEALLVLICSFQDMWMEHTGQTWYPSDNLIRRMLVNHPPEMVEEALQITACRIAGGYFDRYDDAWVKYLWGILRRRTEERA